MSSETDDSREQGIEFGSLAEELANESYPISHEELLDRYGDHELGMDDGSTTLRNLLGPENEQGYEDVQSVRQAIFTIVGSDAVGREGYSDRGGNPPGVNESDNNESI